MELERAVELKADGSVRLAERSAAIGSILLKLAAMGVRIPENTGDDELLHLAGDLCALREQTRLLSQHLCPADARIQRYVDKLLTDVAAATPVRLPAETFILDQYGLAREMSLPVDADAWHNELVSSYRLDNGVLHNPVNDRRTTQGCFTWPRAGFQFRRIKPACRSSLMSACSRRRSGRRPNSCACRSPRESGPEPVETMVSLLLRPLIYRGAGDLARKTHGDPVLRPRRAGFEISTLWRASSATP